MQTSLYIEVNSVSINLEYKLCFLRRFISDQIEIFLDIFQFRMLLKYELLHLLIQTCHLIYAGFQRKYFVFLTSWHFYAQSIVDIFFNICNIVVRNKTFQNDFTFINISRYYYRLFKVDVNICSVSF